MSWRDRDYARLRDDERRALFGGASTTARPRQRARRAPAATPSLLAAVAVSAAAVVLGRHYVHLPLATDHASPSALAPSLPTPARVGHATGRTASKPARAVSIRWRSTDLAPASTAG